MSHSLYLKHYGVKGMKWGVRRYNRREERIAKAQAAGNHKKVARLKKQKAKVQQYRSMSNFDAAKSIGLRYVGRQLAINLSTAVASTLTYNKRTRDFVYAMGNVATGVNTLKLAGDVANVAEARSTKKVRDK